MNGVDDITRVNDMVSELRRHDLTLSTDDAFDQAQSMVLGKPLTEEPQLTPVEKDVQHLHSRMDALSRDMSKLQNQLASMNTQLQNAINQAISSAQQQPRHTDAPAPAQVPAPPRQAPSQEEKQQTLEETEEKFDPSVENIFYCGNK